MNRIIFSLVILSIQTYKAQCNINVNNFDIDDLNNKKFMPLKIFLAPISNNRQKFMNYSVVPKDGQLRNTNIAFNTMDFHRKMMKHFLVSDYIKQQIFRNYTERMFSKKLGNNQLNSQFHIQPTHTTLLENGLTQYLVWLQNMGILDDVYHKIHSEHLWPHKLEENKTKHPTLELGLKNDAHWTDFDVGDVTAYASFGPSISNKYPFDYVNSNVSQKQNKLFIPMRPDIKSDINKHDYETDPHSTYQTRDAAQAKKTSEISFKDISDVALTTLAFFCFGIFTLQVLMCITLGKNHLRTSFLPIDTNEQNNIQAEVIEEIRRRKRSSIDQYTELQGLNMLSERVMSSINKFLPTTDKNACSVKHFEVPCRRSRYSKTHGSTQHIWTQVWFLGLSLLSPRLQFIKGQSENYAQLLKCFKSIGLGFLRNTLCVD